MTSTQDVLAALRRQRDMLEAQTPPDPERIRAVNEALVEFGGETVDRMSLWLGAMAVLNSMETDPRRFDLAAWKANLYVLLRASVAIPKVPEDPLEPVPSVTRDGVVELLHRAAVNPDARFVALRPDLFAALRHHFGVTALEDPARTEVEAAVSLLESAPLDGSVLGSALRELREKRDVILRRPGAAR
jgi:hypothetical protein